MDWPTIRSREDYHRVAQEVDRLIGLDPEPGSPDEQRLGAMLTSLEIYEAEHLQDDIELPDPVEAIEATMDRLELTRRDLEPFIGPASRISEILNRKRGLTLPMIRRLHRGLGIPLEILVQAENRERPRGSRQLRRRRALIGASRTPMDPADDARDETREGKREAIVTTRVTIGGGPSAEAGASNSSVRIPNPWPPHRLPELLEYAIQLLDSEGVPESEETRTADLLSQLFSRFFERTRPRRRLSMAEAAALRRELQRRVVVDDSEE